ncbi:MAG: hypothetical protein AB2L11_02415 [Syntrophobacteraceae bacterium]
MVQHLFAHAAEAAAAFLDAVEVRKTLRQDRIARAWSVFPPAQAGKQVFVDEFIRLASRITVLFIEAE